MIYLDVTSAAHSRLNTGVKRMQRRLHAFLSPRKDYRPVCWQSALRSYRTLSTEEVGNLEKCRIGELPAKALYDAPLPGLLADWKRGWHDRRRRLDLSAEIRSGDLLLVPDLLWDNRRTFFRKPSRDGAMRVGFFHDAIALRRPGGWGLDASLCARAVRMLAEFDQVICISKESEADLHFYWNKFRCRRVATHVLHWPAPYAESRPEPLANFEARTILCISRLEAYKNQGRLLDACEMLWREGLKFRFRLIGCGSYPGQRCPVLDRVDSLRSAGRSVTWQAHVSERKLREEYAACSFTAYPSLMEGFGLPIVESLWHGRPVVCGGNGALGEVAAGGGCEQVDTTSPASLASGLRKLLTDRSGYEQLFQQARDRRYANWKQYWGELCQRIQFEERSEWATSA